MKAKLFTGRRACVALDRSQRVRRKTFLWLWAVSSNNKGHQIQKGKHRLAWKVSPLFVLPPHMTDVLSVSYNSLSQECLSNAVLHFYTMSRMENHSPGNLKHLSHKTDREEVKKTASLEGLPTVSHARALCICVLRTINNGPELKLFPKCHDEGG